MGRDPAGERGGCYGVFFASHQIAAIDLTNSKTEQASAFC
jgi:hypothetical protein